MPPSAPVRVQRSVVGFRSIPDGELLSREYGTSAPFGFTFTTWDDGLLLFCLNQDAVLTVIVNTESLYFTDQAVFGRDLVIDHKVFSPSAEVSDHTCT